MALDWHGPPAIVIMGPSGCGKSTLGRALAAALGWTFIEGDDQHPPENLAKMRRGEPLLDPDRMPFLTNVARELVSHAPAIVSCSALRKAHRDVLRRRVGDVLFVWPDVRHEELARRVAARGGHFMPPSLLQSQISSLEPPSARESFLRVDGSLTVAEQVRAILDYLRPMAGET